MPLAIEDYALIGDCHTAALVGSNGSMDWLCLPRFDSPSVFAGLLGDDDHGHWTVRPLGADRCTERRYDGDSFTLVTRWVTDAGEVDVVDLMPMGGHRADVIRRVRGIRGTVRIEEVLRIRFDYADAIPWVRQSRSERGKGPHEHALIAVAGPDSVIVRGPRLVADGFLHRAEFDVAEGETVDLVLTWFAAHKPPPPMPAVDTALAKTTAWWTRWARHLDGDGPYAAAVRRSLLVLRALTHHDTGGIVAAVTTSLPESFGGDRNWDYRYVWLRDASLTLQALMLHGFAAEAEQWRDWLLRAIAGDPADVQIMYGLAGERRLPEWQVPTLPGYLGAAPVRVGNGAYSQFQGDVFGEIMLALEQARLIGVGEDRVSWPLQIALLGHIEANLERDDHGIWEIRGTPRRFTQSRAMIWAAFECGIRAVREHGLPGPADRWEQIRDGLRREIEQHGFDPQRGTYVQYYGATEVDASLLTLPQIGFIAADDPRMLGTVAAIESDLQHNGLLLRYRVQSGVDGLRGEEHPFLACSFWLVQQYALSGRLPDARRLMDRLVGLANDVGLLSEEYDTEHHRHMGNTPQAFSHLALVRAADAIARATKREDTGPLRLEHPPVT
jgi:GH15 family glucan-1,4-alpha-glucosidase